MASEELFTSDEDYVPGSGSEDDSDDVDERGLVQPSDNGIIVPVIDFNDEDDDDDEDEDEDDEEHERDEEIQEEEDAGDYDDGMEEDNSTASDTNRRAVSIQELLAWRLLGRMPTNRNNDIERRYTAYEEATPQALTRGELWQQVTAATGAAGLARRNQAAHFDARLDESMDCSMHASRAALYGKRVRTALLEAVRTDPRVAAAATLLGPHTPPPTQPPTQPQPQASVGAPASASASIPSTPSDLAPCSPFPFPFPGSTTAATSDTTKPCKGASGRRGQPESGSGPEPGSASRGLAAFLNFRSGKAREEASAAAGTAPEPPPPPPGAPLPPAGYLGGSPVVPSPRMVLRREQGEAAGPGAGAGWSAAQMRHMQCYRAMPRYPRAVVDALDSRAYIGQFSGDGQFFVAAFQDRRVRLYDVDRGWRLRKDITTRMCRWTITDTSVSPDQRFVIYSSIIPVVHLVEVGSPYDCVSSIANITQIHEPLNFDETVNPNGGDFRLGRSFGIWSVQWSGDGREIVAGTNDQSVVVLDVETKRVVARVEGHDNDVNAVTYADSSPNIIVSGSDDTTIKVWDRRVMPSTAPDSPGAPGREADPARGQPVGVLVGHTEGLTHLHSRGDGRHVLSNCKDQTAKIWDIRMVQSGGSLRSPSAAARISRNHVPRFDWDYRWQEYPAAGRVVRHPHDASVQTLRGHTVQHTLIRAYFSPAHSTGQRFVYTGSVEGGVHVYDSVSGQQVEGSPFRLHRKLVRDVSWHPFDPAMATVSWDGTVVRWDAVPPEAGGKGPVVPGRDAFNDYY